MQRITMGLLASSFLLIAPSVRSSALLSQNLELESRRVNGYWREMSGTPQNQKSDDMDFLSQFRRLPPGERMTVWKESNNRKYEKTIAFRVADKIQDTLIAEGTDVVPYLSKVIRNEQERYLYRYLALRILADMDRYVAERDFPPGVKATVVVSELRIRGAINPFLEINGRGIGSQGADALRWAANDKGDKHLQFYAKYETGLVEQELSALSLDVQVRRWEENACKNRIGGQPEDAVASTLLKLLVERMPESLDAVVERVTNGESSCVRRGAIEALRLTDLFRMRLRASETGRAAIEAV